MRVAYLLASFPNTSEIFIINEVAEAVRQGIDVQVFSLLRPKTDCPHEGARRLADRVTYFAPVEDVSFLRLLVLHAWFLLRYRVHYLGALFFALSHRENAMLWTFKVAAHYVKQVARFRPEVLHTHFAYGSARLTMMAAKMMGVPYTFTIHGWGDLYQHPPPDLRTIMLNTKKTITVCDYNRRYILKTYEIPDPQIVLIRCGISPEFLDPPKHDRREHGLIVSVGRLHYHKAFHVLVDACKILVDRGVQFRCRIVGDGELRKDLEAQIALLGLEHKVDLLGARSNEEVRALLQRAQVFVMSSAVETVGLAVVEALASEVPAVATRVYGVPEMVRDGKTGLLREPGDAAGIADALEKLLADEDLRRSMGSRGRGIVLQEHNLPVQVAKLVRVWET